jgi:hypothetical protein
MHILKEPLLHFLLIGAGLFFLFSRVGDPVAGRVDRIVITGDDIDAMSTLWSRRWQRPPTAAELNGLIESRIREEVLYREAGILGLEKDDTIVRRRMAQKMEFLLADLAPQTESTEQELQAFLEENTERFQEPARYSFMHIFLSRDQRGEQVDEDARRVLDELRDPGRNADPLELGDPFMQGQQMVAYSEREVGRVLGRDFAQALPKLPVAQWQGPIESAYGGHLVYVYERAEPHMPALAEIRERVQSELMAERQRQANEAIFLRLRERYEIVIEQDAGRSSVNLASDRR